VLFIICFFCSQFNFSVNNFFLSMNSVLSIAILARMSLVAYPSSEWATLSYSFSNTTTLKYVWTTLIMFRGRLLYTFRQPLRFSSPCVSSNVSTGYTWPSRSNLLFKFLTFGHSGAQRWAPECPSIRNCKCRLHLDGTEHFKM